MKGSLINDHSRGGGGTRYISGWGGAARPLIPWPCLRQISLIFLPCLRTSALIVSAHPYCARKFTCHVHSRPQRPRSFWSAPRIATSGLVQRHSVFEWLCKHNRLRPEPIRFVKLGSEHAQSDGKSVNRGLPVLDLARVRDSWCWPKGARPLGTRMMPRHARARALSHKINKW